MGHESVCVWGCRVLLAWQKQNAKTISLPSEFSKECESLANLVTHMNTEHCVSRAAALQRTWPAIEMCMRPVQVPDAMLFAVPMKFLRLEAAAASQKHALLSAFWTVCIVSDLSSQRSLSHCCPQAYHVFSRYFACACLACSAIQAVAGCSFADSECPSQACSQHGSF